MEIEEREFYRYKHYINNGDRQSKRPLIWK